MAFFSRGVPKTAFFARNAQLRIAQFKKVAITQPYRRNTAIGRRTSQSHIPLHVLCHPRAAGSLISPAPTHRRHPEPSELRPNCAFQPRSATLGPQYAHYTAYIAATHEPIHVPSIQDRRCPDHPPKTHPRHPRPPEPRPNCAFEPKNQSSAA